MGLYPKAITDLQLALIGIPRGKNSQVYIVDPDNGDDDNSGLNFQQPLLTIAEAEDRCIANQHDVVLYLAGAAGINLSAPLVWDKNLTHLIGMCAPTHVGQRARIFQLSTLEDAAPLIDIKASGCIFRDLYIFQGVADADSLINVRVSGGRNYFKNVHFAGGGHVTQAINGGASLNLNGAAAENLFEDCTIGVDTIAAATGMTGLLFDGGTDAVHTTRNTFKNCLFTIKAGHAGASFAESMTIYDFDRYTIFDHCQFLNLAATAMTTAFVIPAGVDPNDKRIVMLDCEMIGAPDWDANDRGLIYLNGHTRTGGGNSGILLAAAAT